MRNRFFSLIVSLLIALTIAPLAQAQATVRVVVNRDSVNVRTVPALGAELVGTANAGTTFTANGRSPNSEWLQVNFAGGEGWVSTVVVSVLEGDVNALPIRDPRSIPYGGQEAPRAGFTDQTSDIRGRLPNTGVRVRGGPSPAYAILANPLRYSEFYLMGRSADSLWVQINYDGTLGWIMTQYIEILDERNINELPVDGIVASQLPLDLAGENEMFAALRYMRERIDLAQPSIDHQRQVWTDAALGVVPFCGDYPSRPTAVNIPREIYAQYYASLNPIVRDFNRAMENIRLSIDLQQEVCGRQGAEMALISPPVVSGGLEAINAADITLASLRRRIDEGLPELTPNDCVFAFSGRVDILPMYPAYNSIVVGEFDGSEYTIGYCFDASPVSVGYLEVLLADTGNYDVLVTLAPLDDPTNFLGSAEGGENTQQSNIVLTNINFPYEGRYLLLIQGDSGRDDVPPLGAYAFILADISLGLPLSTVLTYDENGDAVRTETQIQLADGTVSGGEATTSTSTAATATNSQAVAINVYQAADVASGSIGQMQPGETVIAIGTITDWVQVQLGSGALGWVQASEVTYVAGTTAAVTDTNSGSGALVSVPETGAFCPGVSLTCDELFTCQEVQACIGAGSIVLDPNGNGIACDGTEGNNPLGCSVQVR